MLLKLIKSASVSFWIILRCPFLGRDGPVLLPDLLRGLLGSRCVHHMGHSWDQEQNLPGDQPDVCDQKQCPEGGSDSKQSPETGADERLRITQAPWRKVKGGKRKITSCKKRKKSTTMNCGREIDCFTWTSVRESTIKHWLHWDVFVCLLLNSSVLVHDVEQRLHSHVLQLNCTSHSDQIPTAAWLFHWHCGDFTVFSQKFSATVLIWFFQHHMISLFLRVRLVWPIIGQRQMLSYL